MILTFSQKSQEALVKIMFGYSNSHFVQIGRNSATKQQNRSVKINPTFVEIHKVIKNFGHLGRIRTVEFSHINMVEIPL
jgi:hypothetical protein